MNYKHGKCYTPEYGIFQQARQRCRWRKHKHWKNYGGRGIKFKFKTFMEFWNEVGRRPTKKHTIDRINNDGHYEVGNIRWATRMEQLENRRITQREVALIRWRNCAYF